MIADLGRSDYSTVLDLQRGLADLRNAGRIKDTVILVEHPDVYTEGRHTLARDSIPEAIWVERGGSITYHGPGQLVQYYIINLKERGINVKDLITKVHECTISLLSEYNLSGRSELGKETGVWIGSRKIASTGLAVHEFTTLHGSALNVTTDIKKFSRINPCGFDSSVMTSMQLEVKEGIDFGNIKRKLSVIISEQLTI